MRPDAFLYEASVIHMLRKLSLSERRRSPLASRFAVSYCCFLLVCLALGVALYASSTHNARENFWQQEATQLETNVASMGNHFSLMNLSLIHI